MTKDDMPMLMSSADSKITCSVCKEKGHTKARCPQADGEAGGDAPGYDDAGANDEGNDFAGGSAFDAVDEVEAGG